jgi:hypothetical protein
MKKPVKMAIGSLLFVLASTAVGGIDSHIPYPVYIKDAKQDSLVGVGDAINATIFFNSKVVNQQGLLSLTLNDGRKVQLSVDWDSEYGEGDLVDHIQAQWSPSKKGFKPDDLRQALGQLFDKYPSPYSITVKEARQDSVVGVGDAINATVFFNSRVPNLAGILEFILSDGRKVSLRVDFVPPDKSSEVKEGDPIDHLFAQWSPSVKGFTPDKLKNGRGILFSTERPKYAP